MQHTSLEHLHKEPFDMELALVQCKPTERGVQLQMSSKVRISQQRYVKSVNLEANKIFVKVLSKVVIRKMKQANHLNKVFTF